MQQGHNVLNWHLESFCWTPGCKTLLETTSHFSSIIAGDY
jgi:hypothetical protein